MKSGMRVKVKQIRSQSGRTREVAATLSALGLGRIGKEREHTVNPSLWGMLRKVRHLVRVIEAGA